MSDFPPRPLPDPSGLILPPGLRSDEEATASLANLHDDEVLAIEKVWNDLFAEYSGREVDLDDFAKMARERMAEIDEWVTTADGIRIRVQCGFKITVKMWEDPEDGSWSPELQIDERTEAVVFDHDKKVKQVTGDILGLGTKGTIKDGQADLAGM